MPYERGNWIKGIKSTNPIAVGDAVDYELKNPLILLQEWTIHNIHERKIIMSVLLIYLIRWHIIAPNIDRVLLINNKTTAYYI
jgi:ribosome biogenesis GTPase